MKKSDSSLRQLDSEGGGTVVHQNVSSLTSQHNIMPQKTGIFNYSIFIFFSVKLNLPVCKTPIFTYTILEASQYG